MRLEVSKNIRNVTEEETEPTINWRASEASETLSGLFNRESRIYMESERNERDAI